MSPDAITSADLARIQKSWRASMSRDLAKPFKEGQQELFNDEEEAYILTELARLLYEPRLPNAGSLERKWREELRRLGGDESLVMNVRAACWQYADALDQLLPRREWIKDPRKRAVGERGTITLPGCYYSHKSPVTPKTNGGLFKALMDLLGEAKVKKDMAKKWLAEFLLKGLPVGVSNFKMECLYLLRGADGSVQRLVRLVNTKGEFGKGKELGGADILPNDMYAGSEKFRQWVQSRGNFTWGGDAGAGNTELQALQWDVTEAAAYRVVELVEYCGWYQLPSPRTEPGKLRGLWFMGDVAVPGEGGTFILPDDDGIFWWEGVGYALSPKGRETEFIHGLPYLRPHVGVDSLKLDVKDWELVARKLYEGGNPLGGFFREICRRFTDSVGGMEGLLMVGSVLGYLAAPEIFKLRGQFPSLWAAGQMGSGKTTSVSWLMAFPGFLNVKGGMSVISKSVTAVGIMCQLENYSNLPLWLDEFRQMEIDPAKAAILRDTYDRQLSGKWSPDGLQRKIRTACLVSGETTTSDAATRSRYPYVLIAEKKRLANHYDWMQAHKEHFYLIWRELLLRRAEFVELVLQQIEYWMNHEDLKRITTRDRLTHAVAYAALAAAAVVLESHAPDEQTAYRKFLVRHAERSAADVLTDVNVNVFFDELVTAVQAREIPPELFRVESTLEEDEFGHLWKHYFLWLEPKGVLTALQIYLRKAGSSVTLREKDLRDQMAGGDFFVRAANPHNPLKARFGRAGSKTVMPAWKIDLDKHPLGRQAVSEEIMNAAIKPSHQKTLSDDIGVAFVDGDPRRGPLFNIVEMVEKYEAEQE